MVKPFQNVVLISGGRGGATIARELSRALVCGGTLTVLINGYDDGLSTGACRRAFPKMLGPSDFRKMAHVLGRNQQHTIPLLTRRDIPLTAVDLVSWEDEVIARLLPKSDMAVGNAVFTNYFVRRGQRPGDFQRAVDDYAALCGVSAHVRLVAVSAEPGYLTASTVTGGVLGSEAAITESAEGIDEIYITPSPFLTGEARMALERADLVVVAPGTFHSSILPTLRVMQGARYDRAGQTVWVVNLRPDCGMQGVPYEWMGREISFACPELTWALHAHGSTYAACAGQRDLPWSRLTSDLIDPARPNEHDGARVVEELQGLGVL